MIYVVTKIIEIEAGTPEEAVAKSKDGKTISLSASPPRQIQQIDQSKFGVPPKPAS